MGGVQPSKLAESSTVTGLSYLEDGQFAKIYKVSFLDIFDSLFFPLQEGKTQSFGFLADGMWNRMYLDFGGQEFSSSDEIEKMFK